MPLLSSTLCRPSIYLAVNHHSTRRRRCRWLIISVIWTSSNFLLLSPLLVLKAFTLAEPMASFNPENKTDAVIPVLFLNFLHSIRIRSTFWIEKLWNFSWVPSGKSLTALYYALFQLFLHKRRPCSSSFTICLISFSTFLAILGMHLLSSVVSLPENLIAFEFDWLDFVEDGKAKSTAEKRKKCSRIKLEKILYL